MHNQSRTATERVRTLRLFSLVILMALNVWVHDAAGQGTMGTVPDPISSRELSNYADRLQLSGQQRQAIEEFHETYREEFRVLREGDIEQLVSDSRSMQRGGGFGMLMSDRTVIEKGLKDLDDILNKIKSIDNRFFDSVQSVLTEEQIALVPRVRQARERVRYRTGLSRMTSFLNPATQVDLTEIVSDLELSPDEMSNTDALLSQYESSLTVAAKKMHEGANNMLLEMLDKLAEQGINEGTMRDPERRGQMFQSFRTVMSEVTVKLQELASDITDLNRRTVRSLAPVLSQNNAASLRREFHQQAYNEVHSSELNLTGKAFEFALKLEALNDEQRQGITAMSGEFHASADRIAEHMIDLIDENRKTQSFFDFDQEKRRKFNDELTSQREKQNKLAESSRETLHAVLGPEQTEQLNQRVAEGKGSGIETQEISAGAMIGGPGGTVTSVKGVKATKETNSATSEPQGDPYIPTSITKRNVLEYAERLALSEENKSILNSLHDDYIDKFKALESSEIAAAREAEKKLWATDSTTNQVAPPTDDSIDELFNLRKRALDAILALDAAFFTDVQATILSDEQAPRMQRIVQSRQRDIYNRGIGWANAGRFGGWGGPGRGRGSGDRRGEMRTRGGAGSRAFSFMGGTQSDESKVDLSSVIEAIDLTPTDQAQFDSSLLEYEHAVTQAFQKMFDASMRLQQARDKMNAGMLAASSGGNGSSQRTGEMAGAGFRQLMENEGRAATEAQQVIASLNKTSLAKLNAMLPESDQLQLQRAYNRKAFSQVYSDSRSAEPHLAAALNLPDLNEQQRSQIQQAAADFQGSYDELCEKMVALAATAPEMSGPPQNRDWTAIQDQARAREKLEFDRNDLSDKTIGRLRAILSEDQIQRLGGLQISEE